MSLTLHLRSFVCNRALSCVASSQQKRNVRLLTRLGGVGDPGNASQSDLRAAPPKEAGSAASSAAKVKIKVRYIYFFITS